MPIIDLLESRVDILLLDNIDIKEFNFMLSVQVTLDECSDECDIRIKFRTSF
jgi:hypothetical protein